MDSENQFPIPIYLTFQKKNTSNKDLTSVPMQPHNIYPSLKITIRITE